MGQWFPTNSTGIVPSYVQAFNDNGQILVNGSRYSPSIGWQDFSADRVVFSLGMNQYGDFVGSRDIGTKRYSFRYTNGQMLDLTTGRAATDINSDGDVCVSPSNRGYVYTNKNGMLALDNLVIGSSTDITDWQNASSTQVEAMTDDVGSTGFGAIAGKGVFIPRGVGTTVSRPFLLSPSP